MTSHHADAQDAPSYDVAFKKDDLVRPRNRGRHRTIWSVYAATVVALFTSAGIGAAFSHSGGFMWPVVYFGAVIIAVLLSGVAVPQLRDRSR
ncbi:MAG: hypothetical protein ABI382_11420 [Nakamurella sp.]